MGTNVKPRNPYIAGRSLGNDRGFFGREDVISLVRTELTSPDRSAVVLFGQRRIGKTSILLQLQRHLPAANLLPVYFDLMDRAHHPLGQVLFEMATAISSETGLAAPSPTVFDDEGAYFRREFLPRVWEKLAGRRPVLLLDEFDVLDVVEEGQLPSTAAGRTLFPYLRRLMDAEPQLGFVFVVGRKSEDLSVDVKAAFKSARHKLVSVLDDKSARELILVADQQGTMSYSAKAIDRILEITNRHPYFIQLICQLLWDEAYTRSSVQTPRIELEHVNAIVLKAPEAGENIFEWIWDGLTPAEKVIFAAVAQATETRPLVTLPEILEMLQRQGIRFMTRELELAPDTLVQGEMLRQQEGKYGFSIELMRRWVSVRKPLLKVKDELDRVVPLADTLYQSGDGFYRRGNLENSRNLLRQALTVNPNHLKARLLLGQVLVEQGRAEEAVREMEEAYRYDETSSRYPLLRTLLIRGEELERAGEEEKAIAVCDRALVVSPGDKVASERRTALYSSLGDRAYQRDQLEAAAAAFEKIGAAEKLTQVAARKRKLHLEDLASQAQQLVEEEQWERAGEIYLDLSTLEPENRTWRSSLDRTMVEHRNAKLYADALQALQQEDWRKSQRNFMELLQARPDYKDASELLVRALTPPQPDGVRPSPLIGFPALYCKTVAAIAVCVFAGLLQIKSGSGGIGDTIGFCLGAAVIVGVVLLAIELAMHIVRHRKGYGADAANRGVLQASASPKQ